MEREEFPHEPDRKLHYQWQHSMEGVDQTYIEWLESELKTMQPFRDAFEAVERIIIERGINIDTKKIRQDSGYRWR